MSCRRPDAAPGSPLAQLAILLRDRRARTVAGACLVAPTLIDTSERYGLGLFGAELADVLARHVQISAIDDEETFHITFAEHLAAAKRSIWLRLRTVVHFVVAVQDMHQKIVVIDERTVLVRQEFAGEVFAVHRQHDFPRVSVGEGVEAAE